MYCEPGGQKPQNQCATPLTFISSAFTISGKTPGRCTQTSTLGRFVRLRTGTQAAFLLARPPHAGDVAVPRPEGDGGDHQQPRRVLHPAGLCPAGQRAHLRALHRPAALVPLAGLRGPAGQPGRGHEPAAVSPGEGRAAVGGPGRRVHQAVLPGEGVLERPHGPARRPTQQAGARQNLQTARYSHVS